MHAICDRLTIDETAQPAAQLSEMIRGIYYEDWDPNPGQLPRQQAVPRAHRRGGVAGR
jgi:uncharacterized protein (DUF2267 family)